MEETTQNSTTPPSEESLREQGNSAMKEEKYAEAMLHYTRAIKVDPKNYILYSNRSAAFLKLKQYQLAMEDAMTTIMLNPEWAKGYFRRGEVEFATNHFAEAQESYETALKLKPDDQTIYSAIERAHRAYAREKTADTQVPWVGAGIGIVVGVVILIADFMLTENPTHPLIMAFVTIGISIVSYFIAKFVRETVKNSKKLNLDSSTSPENDDEEQAEDDASDKNGKVRNRYTKSQARQRFRKGKM